jgi:hypothetical protein
MAEVSVEADLTEVDGFPAGEELHRHEDLVACYGRVREAVATHVPAVEVLARLPLVRVFLYVLLCLWRINAFCIKPLMMK